MPRRHPASPRTTRPATALWLSVPLVAGAAGALGWERLRGLQEAGHGSDPQLTVAVLAAGACLAVAGWWIGGLLMLGLASLARVLRWRSVERWASRLTPRLVLRSAGALVGAQLVAMAPVHADDAAPDPFWAPATSGTEQLAPGDAPAPAGGTAADPAPTTGTGRGPDVATGAEHSASPLPDRPESTQAPGGPTSEPAERPAWGTAGAVGRQAPHPRDRIGDGALTVVAGDTLWDITAQLLGPGATDGAVCSHLGSWLAHNTLAHHGDLIRPGDVLQVPSELLNATGGTP